MGNIFSLQNHWMQLYMEEAEEERRKENQEQEKEIQFKTKTWRKI